MKNVKSGKVVISVRKLREMLIEVPGDYHLEVTAVENLRIWESADTTTHLGDIKLDTEQTKLKATA